MSSDIVGINLQPSEADNLADRIRRAGQARALTTFAKQVEEAAKADLRAEVDAEAERTGTGFSAKVDGIRASLSDPQPKPHVTDVEAFHAWWVEQGLENEATDVVEVMDHGRVAAVLRLYVEQEEILDTDWLGLLDALVVRTEYVLPAKPVDTLTASGRCVATDSGLRDVETGELVPGVDCHRGDPVLSVTPDTAAKARDGAVVRSYFGFTPEVGP